MRLFPTWMRSRKRHLLSGLCDFLLITILFLKFNELEIYKNSFLIFIQVNIYWISLSYIFGRYYTYEKKYKSKIFIQALKTSILFLSIIFIENILNFKNPIEFYLSITIFSFLVQCSLNNFYKKIFSGEKIWCFVGDNRLLKNINHELKMSRNNSQVIPFESFINMEKNDFESFKKNIIGFLIDENISLKPVLKLMQFPKNKKHQNLNLLNWSENILQKIPIDFYFDASIQKYFNKSNKNHFQLKIKRISDIIFSLLLIVITFPVLLISAFLIKLEDGGPIFYTQTRNGLNKKEFQIIKLRTMKINSENNGAVWSKKNDSRITKMGFFLRLTRIDELPQLINVLNNKMSLIGPRPERPEIDIMLNKNIKDYFIRYNIKPGLSGWAQVNYPYGASIIDSKNKLGYDLYYLKNFSIFLDFLIFLKTISLVFNARGAIAK